MKFQKRFLVLLSSLLVIFPLQIALNCVDYPSTDQIRVVHFFKDIFEFNDLYRFIYETEHLEYRSGFHQKQLSEADLINVQEWKAKLHNKEITDKDIITFLYELHPATYWKHQAEWDLNNRFLHTAKTRFPEIYTYLQLLKETESAIGGYSSPGWDDDHGAWKDLDIQNRTQKLLNATEDDFLKRRYAYKLICLAFYDSYWSAETGAAPSASVAELQQLFVKYFENGPKDWLYYSALHYYGQVTAGDYLLESYMYGKDKRARTATIISRKYLSKIVTTGSDLKKRAACLGIISLTNPGRNLRNLKQIYAYDTDNRDFNFLVTREVNKLENWLWTKKISDLNLDDYYYYDGEQRQYLLNFKSDYAYSAEVLMFLKQAYYNPRITEENKLFLSMTIGYIEILRGNMKDANHILVQDMNQYESDRYKLQAKVIITLMSMYTKGADVRFETDLLALLREVRSMRTLDTPDLYYEQLIRTIAEYYKSVPALRARGFLLNSRNGLVRNGTCDYMNEVYNNASVADIDHMFAIIKKKDKNAFEKFITAGVSDIDWYYDEDLQGKEQLTPLDTMRFIDYKGMMLMRENKLEEALTVYSKLSDSTLKGEPFNYISDDVFIFRYKHAGEYRYTKKTFLAQLIKYKKALNANPNDPLINYYVGNAYLNMTIYGNAWPMLSNYISSGTPDKEYATRINHHYIHGDWAIPYFEKALANAKDPKLKVLIQINLGYIRSLHITDKKKEIQVLKKLCVNKHEQEMLLEVHSNCDLYYDYIKPFVKEGDRIAPRNRWTYNYYY